MTSDTAPTVRVRRRFDVSSERVFDAWLDPAKARQFLFATPSGRMVRADIDARVGGAFTFVDRRDGEDVEHTGTYLEIERPRRLVFTFSVPKYSAVSTRVIIEIVSLDTGCELTLTHEGVLPEWAARTESGWTAILEGLASALSRNAPRATAGDPPASTLEQPTCGTGLAAHAELPATLGELLAAMADVLDTHQQALDLTDESARPEHHAYLTLVLEFRATSAQLTATARRMVGYRTLPIGRHDDQKISSREARESFERFVRIERKLLSHLADTVGNHQTLLDQMA
jgi:uncharacterized protein YndB with AHSA1/START domain